MNIDIEENDGIHLVKLEGNLDTNTAPEAQAALDELVSAGASQLLLDFTALDYVSSAGLRVLLATGKKLKRSGGKMHLFALNETVEEVFEISGFSSIFDVFSDEAAARGAL
jgi:anti-anti-sigma factor